MNPFLFSNNRSLLPKRLIQWTAGATLLTQIATKLSGISFFELFCLTPNALYAFWQPITALFVIPIEIPPLGFLLDMAFLMVLLRILSSQIIDFFDIRHFLFLYFGASFAATLAALITMHTIGSSYFMLSTCPAALLALFTVWSMCAPAQNILFMLLLPISQKWMLVLALIATIVFNLLSSNYVAAAAYSGSFLFGYLVAIMGWYLKSPFESLHPLEAHLKRFSNKLQTFWQWKIASFWRRR